MPLSARLTMTEQVRALLELGRVSNLPSVVTNVLAAWILTGSRFGFGLVGLVIGSVLLYLGGTTLNDAIDVKFDRENRPERPIPAGVFSARMVWLIGIAYLVVGSGLLIVLTKAWPVWVAALVVAIVVYDVVHKKWQGAVFVMGSCRLFLYLVAASAAIGGTGVKLPVLIWAAALFLYIVGLTFVARGESTGGGVPQMAIAFLAAPVVAGAISLALGGGGGFEFAICLLVLMGWIGLCLWRLRGDDPARIGRFVGGLLAGIPLIDALAVSSLVPWLALVFLLALPLSMILQRMVAAT